MYAYMEWLLRFSFCVIDDWKLCLDGSNLLRSEVRMIYILSNNFFFLFINWYLFNSYLLYFRLKVHTLKSIIKKYLTRYNHIFVSNNIKLNVITHYMHISQSKYNYSTSLIQRMRNYFAFNCKISRIVLKHSHFVFSFVQTL